MNLDLVNRIADAVLYEGYMLYPYRPTAVKNQQRWNFGVLYPQAYSDAQGGTESASMQTECLLLAHEDTVLDVRIRFLHLLQRQIGKLADDCARLSASEPEYQPVVSLEVDGQLFQSWQEATEREVIVPPVNLPDLMAAPRSISFSFPATRRFEFLSAKDGRVAGVMVRRQELVQGEIRLAATPVGDGVVKLSVQISNRGVPLEFESEVRDQALLRSTVSTHTILGVSNGEFVSLLDIPANFAAAASQCANIGTWPVLVGAPGDKEIMLSSPIILYDYPEIAPESAGDLFDGTEIDEILTLRIMTLTEEEKQEMRGADERARQILERTETLPLEQLLKMHGAVRGLKQVAKQR